MKQLIFNAIVALVLFGIGSCSDKSKDSYSANDFEGRIFLSDKYGSGLRAKLRFSEKFNNLEAVNIPWDINFSKEYEILPRDSSPSGNPTLSVDSEYYFIISDKNELIYRYYEGPVEKTVIFREIYE